MLAHAQRTDDRADALFQLADRAVVEMIPVVVRDDEVVDVGHLFGAVDVGAFERTVEHRERRRVAENRIDERPAPFGLNQLGRVPEPDQQVAFGIERPQVGADRRAPHRGDGVPRACGRGIPICRATGSCRPSSSDRLPDCGTGRRGSSATAGCVRAVRLGADAEARQTDDDECGGQRREQDA